MKALAVSIASAAILLLAAGIGSGFAQAGGTHSDRPVLSFEDRESLEGGTSRCEYDESRPVLSFEEQEDLASESRFIASGESRPVLSFDDQETVRLAMREEGGNNCIYR